MSHHLGRLDLGGGEASRRLRRVTVGPGGRTRRLHETVCRTLCKHERKGVVEDRPAPDGAERGKATVVTSALW